MIVLRGGAVYDPANGLNGEIRDVWIDGERIAAAPQPETPFTEVDARGWIVAPGAIEIHAHFAGAARPLARSLLLSEDQAVLRLPHVEQVADTYLRLGYTTLFDAAMSPLLARRAHADLAQMETVDRGVYTLAGDQTCVLSALRHNDPQELEQTLAWLLDVSGGYAVKLVNPGVGLAWRAGNSIETLDDELDPSGLTPRGMIQAVAGAVQALGLPHPLHLHAGKLGLPGNARNFCETARALQGLPAHLCHIQFFSYADDEKGQLRSAAGPVAECIEACPNLTFDVGQVIFGPALTVTADLQAAHMLHKLGGVKWACRLLEGEGGLGMLPLQYLAKDASSAVQWATGLELLLRSPDPARLFLTTDYPNGGPFTAYPQLIAWLMDRDLRREALGQVHAAARERTGLADLEREYSLAEVVRMTSAGPARALGLTDRGQLGIGARADIRCYRSQADRAAMFACPELVVKDGEVVVRAGEIVSRRRGATLVARPGWETGLQPVFAEQIRRATSVDPRHYGLGDEAEISGVEVVACRSVV